MSYSDISVQTKDDRGPQERDKTSGNDERHKSAPAGADTRAARIAPYSYAPDTETVPPPDVIMPALQLYDPRRLQSPLDGQTHVVEDSDNPLEYQSISFVHTGDSRRAEQLTELLNRWQNGDIVSGDAPVTEHLDATWQALMEAARQNMQPGGDTRPLTQDEWAHITGVLQQTEAGRAILNWVETIGQQQGLAVHLGAPGEGSYFDYSDAQHTRIVIDADGRLQDAIGDLAHEVVHALYFLNHQTADTNLPEQDFVKGKISEEAVSELLRIMVQYNSLQSVNEGDTIATYARDTFNKAVAEADPHLSVQEQNRQGIGVTLEALQQVMGEELVSISTIAGPMTYEHYYQEVYQAHGTGEETSWSRSPRPWSNWRPWLTDQVAEATNIRDMCIQSGLPQTFINLITPEINRVINAPGMPRDQAENILNPIDQMLYVWKNLRTFDNLPQGFWAYMQGLGAPRLAEILSGRLSVADFRAIPNAFQLPLILIGLRSDPQKDPNTVRSLIALPEKARDDLVLRIMAQNRRATTLKDIRLGNIRNEFKELRTISTTWTGLVKDLPDTDPAKKALRDKIESLDITTFRRVLNQEVSIYELMHTHHFTEDDITGFLPRIAGVWNSGQANDVVVAWGQLRELRDIGLTNSTAMTQGEMDQIIKLKPTELRELVRDEVLPDYEKFAGRLSGRAAFWLEWIKYSEADQNRMCDVIERLETLNPELYNRMWDNFVVKQFFPTIFVEMLVGDVPTYDYPSLFSWDVARRGSSTPGQAAKDQVTIDDIQMFIEISAPTMHELQERQAIENAKSARGEAAQVILTTPEDIIRNVLDTMPEGSLTEPQRLALAALINPNQPDNPVWKAIREMGGSFEKKCIEGKERWLKKVAVLRSIHELTRAELREIRYSTKDVDEITLASLPQDTLERLIHFKELRKDEAKAVFSGEVHLSELSQFLHPQDLPWVLKFLLPEPLQHDFGGRSFDHIANILDQVFIYGKDVDVFKQPFLMTGYYGIAVYRDSLENALALGGTGGGKSAYLIAALLLANMDPSRSVFIAGDKSRELYRAIAGWYQLMGFDVATLSLGNPNVPEKESLHFNPLALIPAVGNKIGLSDKEIEARELERIRMAGPLAKLWTEQAVLYDNMHSHHSHIEGLPANIETLFLALILHLREADVNNPRSFCEIHDLLLKDRSLLFTELRASNSGVAQTLASSIEKLDQDMQDRVFAAALGSAKMLDDPAVRRLMASGGNGNHNGVDFTTLLMKPTLLFLDVPFLDIARMRPIVELIQQMMFRQLENFAEDADQNGKKLPQRGILGIFEEAGALVNGSAGSRDLPNELLPGMAAYGRSPLGLSIIMSAQSLDQLDVALAKQVGQQFMATGANAGDIRGIIDMFLGWSVKTSMGTSSATRYSKQDGVVVKDGPGVRAGTENSSEETYMNQFTVEKRQALEDLLCRTALSQIRNGVTIFCKPDGSPIIGNARYRLTNRGRPNEGRANAVDRYMFGRETTQPLKQNLKHAQTPAWMVPKGVAI